VKQPHPHPSERPLLPLLMVVTFLAALVLLRFDWKHSALAAGFAFAWFLTSFALYGYTWLQREHDTWRQAHIERSEP
jgi:hypothetical protein